ncbi:MAG: type IV pilus biogenesis/stability protein PilW [Sedimenticola thiotaurini]|uniref:Type IV pilus biogenesis/stability protein PilW n=1 Tax=Sedimenticola thiotaurini TaxID=1543721 RepID=A0A558D8V2_9GAMM|nr:MAG: type IV pilus biogenesis/stability protein PilW [Sedimenticola thiotaurini]
MTDSTGQFGVNTRTGAGDVYVKLAIAYMREGHLDVALQKANQGLELEPTNAEGHNVIALLYDRLGEKGLAEDHFKRSLKIDPKNSYVLNAYATFLCQKEHYEDADRYFLKALENPLYKTPEVALTNAGICAERSNDLGKAEAYLRRALNYNPKFPTALMQMSRISFKAGENLSSRAYLQRYLEQARPNAASLWLGIQNERILGNQDAVSSYTLMLKNGFPDSNEVQLLKDSEKE